MGLRSDDADQFAQGNAEEGHKATEARVLELEEALRSLLAPFSPQTIGPRCLWCGAVEVHRNNFGGTVMDHHADCALIRVIGILDRKASGT